MEDYIECGGKVIRAASRRVGVVAASSRLTRYRYRMLMPTAKCSTDVMTCTVWNRACTPNTVTYSVTMP